MPTVTRWTFFDPVDNVTYTFHVNPNDGGSPNYKKNIHYEKTTAPDGKTLVFEGQDEVNTLEWSGVILEQAHYDKYIEWWQLRRQIYLTDDLNRSYWIYLTSFTPKRVRARERPWKHTFSVTATILDWA